MSISLRSVYVHLKQMSVSLRSVYVHLKQMLISLRRVYVHLKQMSISLRSVYVHLKQMSISLRSVYVHLKQYLCILLIQKQEAELLEMEKRKEFEDKRRKQQEAREMYSRSLQMKKSEEAREMQQQMAFDMKLLEQLLEESKTEEVEAAHKKAIQSIMFKLIEKKLRPVFFQTANLRHRSSFRQIC